jgi:hypothetical protein
MSTITNEFMQQMMTTTKPYSIVILKNGPNSEHVNRQQIVWEHGRKNFELRAAGLLSIVCPIIEANDIRGVGIFHTNIEDTRKLMEEDPGVKEGVFVYEILASRSFPGDRLP